jgi:hypothetical protein
MNSQRNTSFLTFRPMQYKYNGFDTEHANKSTTHTHTNKTGRTNWTNKTDWRAWDEQCME